MKPKKEVRSAQRSEKPGRVTEDARKQENSLMAQGRTVAVASNDGNDVHYHSVAGTAYRD